jgi:hypothetical protein
MLDVKAGGRGLRQSDAVFLHVLNLKKMAPDASAKAGQAADRVRRGRCPCEEMGSREANLDIERRE